MADQVLKIIKALSDETRIEIVRDLLDGHRGICPDLQKNLAKSQPTLSHHVGKLVDAEVLIESKKGVNCYYKVNSKYLKSLGLDIKKLVNKN